MIDAGPLPLGWKGRQLKDLADFLDHQRRPVKSADRATAKGIYPYYGATGVIDYVDDYLFDEELVLLGEDGENILSRQLPQAFRISGKTWVNNHAHVLRPKHNVDAVFLGLALERLNFSIYNSGSAQPKLTKGTCESIVIAFPEDDQEQKSIAQALSDIDNLIVSLAALIAKQRKIMQGAMQQLLTGKRRLPGYSETWKTHPLGEIGEIAGSGVDKKLSNDQQPVRLLNYVDVYKNNYVYSVTPRQIVTASDQQIRRCRISRGDVFFTYSSETPDDAAHAAIAVNPISDAVYSYHLVRWRPNSIFDANYLAFAFQTDAFRHQSLQACEGSGTRYVITLPRFRSLTLSYPRIDEQAAIGVALHDMAREISCLAVRKTKYEQLRAGMMQQLLSGRIRLI